MSNTNYVLTNDLANKNRISENFTNMNLLRNKLYIRNARKSHKFDINRKANNDVVSNFLLGNKITPEYLKKVGTRSGPNLNAVRNPINIAAADYPLNSIFDRRRGLEPIIQQNRLSNIAFDERNKLPTISEDGKKIDAILEAYKSFTSRPPVVASKKFSKGSLKTYGKKTKSKMTRFGDVPTISGPARLKRRDSYVTDSESGVEEEKKKYTVTKTPSAPKLYYPPNLMSELKDKIKTRKTTGDESSSKTLITNPFTYTKKTFAKENPFLSELKTAIATKSFFGEKKDDKKRLVPLKTAPKSWSRPEKVIVPEDTLNRLEQEKMMEDVLKNLATAKPEGEGLYVDKMYRYDPKIHGDGFFSNLLSAGKNIFSKLFGIGKKIISKPENITKIFNTGKQAYNTTKNVVDTLNKPGKFTDKIKDLSNLIPQVIDTGKNVYNTGKEFSEGDAILGMNTETHPKIKKNGKLMNTIRGNSVSYTRLR